MNAYGSCAPAGRTWTGTKPSPTPSPRPPRPSTTSDLWCRRSSWPDLGWAPAARGAAIGPYPGPVDEVVRTAGEAMLTTPVRHPLSVTVREIREFFRDDHVHAALIVSPAGYLEAVVERGDIAGYQAPDTAPCGLRVVPAAQ